MKVLRIQKILLIMHDQGKPWIICNAQAEGETAYQSKKNKKLIVSKLDIEFKNL